MKKPKIFIACDTTSLTKVKKIIKQSKTNKIKIGYKFGLEFMNSKNGRGFVSRLRNKIIFVDLKLNDTVNTMLSAVKALRDLKIKSKPVKFLIDDTRVAQINSFQNRFSDSSDEDFYYAAMDFITPRSCLTHILSYK